MTQPGDDWTDYDPRDSKSHPEEGAVIEVQYENGSRAEVTYSRAGAGYSETLALDTPSRRLKLARWRYKSHIFKHHDS
jgi:hypothetical protein